MESTQYPGIYKRITADGKLEGYQIKPRFPGYSGPKSYTRDRLTDARELLDQIRQDLRKGISGTKSQLLVLDEVGYLPLTRAEANYLFQVVSHRYERSSLILTSNKSVTEWPEVFGDHAIATAILDRLLHHAHVLAIKGNSYRLRDRALAALTNPAPETQAAS